MIRSASSSLLLNPDCVILKEPSLMFNPGAVMEIEDPLEGLRHDGPFDLNAGGRTFSKIKLLAIAPKNTELQQRMAVLAEALLTPSQLYCGLKAEFGLSEARVEDIDCPPPERITVRDIEEVIRRMPPGSRFDSNSENRTIVIWGGPDHKATVSQGHRAQTKRECLRMGIPTQYLSNYESRELRGILAQGGTASFPFSLHNLAVNLYAKIGGVPWVLKSPELGMPEVDAAAGFRFVRSKPGDETAFVIGALSVFGKHGQLCGFESSRFHDIDESGKRWEAYSDSASVSYEDSKIMTEMLLRVHRKRMNQSPQHLVVHRLGPYHPQEIKGIVEALEDEGIRRFALLEIIRDNGLRLFRDLGGNILSTPRGLSWALSSDSALLGTTGDVQVTTLQGVKTKKHVRGTPLPIVVRIRKSLNSFSNIHQASQNVFVLTALHWGSMYSMEIQLPVTLDFAQRIASCYRDGIEPHDCLRDTPWFL